MYTSGLVITFKIRIHGIIKHGGDSPNVIPAYTSGKFYARAQTKNQLTELRPRVENCFKAAAKATQCQVKLHWADVGPLDDVFMNDTMTLRFKKYEEEQGITFDSRSDEEQTTTGSTDFGNFSYVVPGIHPAYGIHTTAANHTRGYVYHVYTF
jgi:metal-dependent amidase/aminoacylase/carboxypeptidase family protein